MNHTRTVRLSTRLATLAMALAVFATATACRAYTRDDDDERGEKVEKQIAAIENRLMAIQEREINLSMKIMQAKQQAQKNLDEPGKAAQKLAKGERSRDLLKYRAVLLAAARQLQQFDRQLMPLVKQAQALQRYREKAPKMLQARIDAVTSRVRAKHRGNLEKVASFYEQAAAFKPALGTYLQVYQSIPEKERLKNDELIKTIGELYDKSGNPKQALAFYSRLFEAKDPKHRYNDTKFAEKVGDLHAKCGNARTALEIYRKVYDKFPDDKRNKGNRDRLMKKINEVRKKAR